VIEQKDVTAIGENNEKMWKSNKAEGTSVRWGEKSTF
jgi:hypothetical protein